MSHRKIGLSVTVNGVTRSPRFTWKANDKRLNLIAAGTDNADEDITHAARLHFGFPLNGQSRLPDPSQNSICSMRFIEVAGIGISFDAPVPALFDQRRGLS